MPSLPLRIAVDLQEKCASRADEPARWLSLLVIGHSRA
jgi:hypothetical protein